MDEIVEKLAEQTGGVLEKAYTDIVEPSAKPLGIMSWPQWCQAHKKWDKKKKIQMKIFGRIYKTDQ